MKYTLSILLISLLLSLPLNAQQDRYKYRLSAGVGNTFDTNGKLLGQGGAQDGVVSFKTDYLAVGFNLERMWRSDLSVGLFAYSTGGVSQLRNLGVQLNYFTDNGYLLPSRSFVAPFFIAGVAVDRQQELNIPFGGGLKFRIARSLSLSASLQWRAYPDQWEAGTSAWDTRSLLSLQYSFARDQRPVYTAPQIYASGELAPDTTQIQKDTTSSKVIVNTSGSKTNAADTLQAIAFEAMFERHRDSILPSQPNLKPSALARDTSLWTRIYRDTNISPDQSTFTSIPATSEPQGDVSQPSWRDTSLELIRHRLSRLELQSEQKSQDVQEPEVQTVTSASESQSQRLQELEAQLSSLGAKVELLLSGSGEPAISNSEPTDLSSIESRLNALENRPYTASERIIEKSESPVIVAAPTFESSASREQLREQEEELRKLRAQVDSLRRVKSPLPDTLVKQAAADSLPPAVSENDLLKVIDSTEVRLGQMFREELNQRDEVIVDLQNQLQRTRTRADSLRRQLNEPAPLSFTKREIFFAINSTKLSAEAIAQLRQVVSFALENPGAHFIIRGFTDLSGSVDYNRKLSQRRAEAAREYLLRQGLEANRLTTESMGPDPSVSASDSQYGRRVEVVLRK